MSLNYVQITVKQSIDRVVQFATALYLKKRRGKRIAAVKRLNRASQKQAMLALRKKIDQIQYSEPVCQMLNEGQSLLPVCRDDLILASLKIRRCEVFGPNKHLPHTLYLPYAEALLVTALYHHHNSSSAVNKKEVTALLSRACSYLCRGFYFYRSCAEDKAQAIRLLDLLAHLHKGKLSSLFPPGGDHKVGRLARLSIRQADKRYANRKALK